MKVKDFIKELQKCNPEGEVFTENIEGFYAVTKRRENLVT